MLPVGLENIFNPDGHSGQPKLHAVVGSMVNDVGIPHIAGLDISLE